MKVIRPSEHTLIYTNVAANDEPTWESGTTYAQSALVKVTDVDVHKVYRSTRGGNINRYPPDWTEPQQETATSSTSHEASLGAKTFTTQSGKGFSPGMVVQIAKTTTPRTVNMTAEVVSYSGTSLAVSVYAKTGDGTHAAWTITSEDEIGFWSEVGATNQYACLDEYVNTQTEHLEIIHLKFSAEKLDYVSLFNLKGADVEFTLWDADETTVLWTETVSLIYGTAGVQSTSWSDYFFGEFNPRTECSFPIPFAAANAVIEIKVIAADGTDAAIGNVLIGRSHDIGQAVYGMNAGILDFSMAETDDQGRTKVAPGPWSKRCEIDLRLPRRRVDGVHSVLSSLHGTPTAWIGVPGVDGYDSFTIYGTFREFDLTVPGNLHAWCRLEIEGLI